MNGTMRKIVYSVSAGLSLQAAFAARADGFDSNADVSVGKADELMLKQIQALDAGSWKNEMTIPHC